MVAAPGGGQLQRVTVNLIPRALGALHATMTRTGDSKTDTINRALQVYALVLELMDGRDHLVVVSPEGVVERVYIARPGQHNRYTPPLI